MQNYGPITNSTGQYSAEQQTHHTRRPPAAGASPLQYHEYGEYNRIKLSLPAAATLSLPHCA
jgi:hypothetical protein